NAGVFGVEILDVLMPESTTQLATVVGHHRVDQGFESRLVFITNGCIRNELFALGDGLPRARSARFRCAESHIKLDAPERVRAAEVRSRPPGRRACLAGSDP